MVRLTPIKTLRQTDNYPFDISFAFYPIHIATKIPSSDGLFTRFTTHSTSPSPSITSGSPQILQIQSDQPIFVFQTAMAYYSISFHFLELILIHGTYNSYIYIYKYKLGKKVKGAIFFIFISRRFKNPGQCGVQVLFEKLLVFKKKKFTQLRIDRLNKYTTHSMIVR